MYEEHDLVWSILVFSQHQYNSWISGFFHKIFGGGPCFQGLFSVPIKDGVRSGDSRWGRSQMRGDLEKLSAETKNVPLQQN